MKIVAIYDNGGDTLDRFTVVTDEQEYDARNTPNLYMSLGLSEGGDGFSQWGAAQWFKGSDDAKNKHLGKRVQFESLSANTQKHIARRIFSE